MRAFKHFPRVRTTAARALVTGIWLASTLAPAYSAQAATLSLHNADAAQQITCPDDLPAPIPGALRIMPMGDSITEGGAYSLSNPPSTPPHESYRLYLHQQLTAAGKNVEFVGTRFSPPFGDKSPFKAPWSQGQSGAVIGPDPNYFHSLASGLEPTSGYANIRKAIQCTRPNIILLMIGTNDLIRRFDVPGYADGAPDKLQALVQQLQIALRDNGLGKSQILIASTLPWLVSTAVQGSPEQFEINGRAEQLGALDPFDNVHFVDMYNRTGLVAADYFNEGLGVAVHFKKTGATKIAKVWFDSLRDFVFEPVAPCANTNLLKNGDFDNDTLDNWTSYTAFGSDISATNKLAHMGRNGWMDQVIPTTPNKTHYLAAWVRINIEVRKPITYGLWLVAHSENFSSYYNGSRYLTAANTPPGTWKRIAFTFTPVTTRTRLTYRNYGDALDKPDGLYDADIDQIYIGTCPGSAASPDAGLPRKVMLPVVVR